MNFCIDVFVWTYVFFSLGYIVRNGIAGSSGNSTFHLLRNRFPKWLHPFAFSPAASEVPDLSAFLPTFAVIGLSDYSPPCGRDMVSHRGFALRFLVG